MFQIQLKQSDAGIQQCFSFMRSRRATRVSPAVRAVGGVNAGQLPFAPPAILSPTAARAAQGPEAVTASVAFQVTGTTAPPAARVSHLSLAQLAKCSPFRLNKTPPGHLSIGSTQIMFSQRKKKRKRKRAALRVHIPTPTTTAHDVREASAEGCDPVA